MKDDDDNKCNILKNSTWLLFEYDFVHISQDMVRQSKLHLVINSICASVRRTKSKIIWDFTGLLKGSSINTVHKVVLTITNVSIPKRDLKELEASGIVMSKIHSPICDDRTNSTPVTELL